ncbi:MAG: hypothetical protein B7Z02_03130 [Rhodobacterales bacterium 32-67-9]|nr:MAG: hypothetical protein B7Z02_03130 [Rhodobacterales bacterium 32-67-9]
MKRTISTSLFALALSLSSAHAQGMPFGSEEDTAYAKLLWDVMQAERLVGPDMLRAKPYEGTDPHGMMLETFYTKATINDHTGDLIVKRNFGPAGVTEDQVLADPDKHLGAVTVMFRREDGYDPDDMNWFWVKYLPDGSLDKTPNGMAMAGQIAKGMDEGCIACHQGAADDMVFTSDYLLAN